MINSSISYIKTMEIPTRALSADWAPGPGVLVFVPPVARSLMCRALIPSWIWKFVSSYRWLERKSIFMQQQLDIEFEERNNESRRRETRRTAHNFRYRRSLQSILSHFREIWHRTIVIWLILYFIIVSVKLAMFEMRKCKSADLFASLGDILCSEHSSIGRGLVSVRLHLHSSRDVHNRFAAWISKIMTKSWIFRIIARIRASHEVSQLINSMNCSSELDRIFDPSPIFPN